MQHNSLAYQDFSFNLASFSVEIKKSFAPLGIAEKNHHFWKDHCRDGLKFNKTGFDQKKHVICTYVVKQLNPIY